MEIQTIKRRGNGYLVTNSSGFISVPNDPDNCDYAFIQAYISAGGIVEPEFTNQELSDAELALAKTIKLSELESLYTAAQVIKVVNGHSFYVPLKGDFFNTVVTNQVLAASINGSASLILTDINGITRILVNIPFIEWQKFYLKAKTISFSNLIVKSNLAASVNSCVNISELEAIDLNIFPIPDEVILDI